LYVVELRLDRWIKSVTKRLRKSISNTAEDWTNQACELWEKGKLSDAHKLFLKAAKAGEVTAQNNLAIFYDDGLGVQRNPKKAIYRFKQAYNRGYSVAASNLGVIYRKNGRLKTALRWFVRAANLGDEEADLHIGRLYLQIGKPELAIESLTRVCRSDMVSEDASTDAKKLLRSLRRKPSRAIT
jgi:TPR repeat protein